VLRATAILLVLAAHTWPSKAAINLANACGVLGVELFFVLSGYLIGGILIRQTDTGRLDAFEGLVDFWRRRWFRTLPNYYLFLGLHVGWRSLVLGFPDVLPTEWEYVFFLQNFRAGPDFFFPETWSLAIEEWFYLLFALFLWAGFRLSQRPAKTWNLVVGAFLIVPCLVRIWYVMRMGGRSPDGWAEGWDGTMRRTVILRLDVVMYGVVGALVAARRPDWWRLAAKLWPLALIPVAFGTTSLLFDFPLDRGKALDGLLLWPCMAIGFALLLPRFSMMAEKNGWPAELIRWVARLSYALYLCHGLVLLVLWRYFGQHAHSFWNLHRQTWPWCLIAWAVAFAFAWMVYCWFEKPFMDLRDRKPVR